jgi:hypothetical protein
MNGFQIVFIILLSLTTFISAVLHGRPKEGKHNLGTVVIALTLQICLIVFGWAGVGPSAITFNGFVIALFILHLISLIIGVIQDGTDYEENYNIMTQLTAVLVINGLLYFAGYWG